MARIVVTILTWVLIFSYASTKAADKDPVRKKSERAKQEALRMLNEIEGMAPSEYWPGVDPELFIQNLRLNISAPDSIHQGNRTNFCGYAVATYLYAQIDPKTYVSSMLRLYKSGAVKLNDNSVASPPIEVRRTAGTLENKGALVKRPADQMWYLTLASHFRGFINIFNKHFQRGDENTLWASMQQRKLNRMLQSLFKADIDSKTKGIIVSGRTKMAKAIMQNQGKGEVILYSDDTFKTKGKKKHYFPSHYLVIEKMELEDNKYHIQYWDYGAVKQITLKRSVFERAARGYSILVFDELAYHQNDALMD